MFPEWAEGMRANREPKTPCDHAVLLLRQGRIPRGGHVFADLRDAFPGGETAIAASSFPMIPPPSPDRFIPAGPALTVWMEQMKLPPLD